ncbi:putative sensor-like histidine kinase [compost metagenome]
MHSQTIDSLMSLLRAHLRVNEPLALEDECKLLAQYVSIMRMRNRLDIGFTVDLPEQFRSIKVPRLLLQPLVENSIVHGMKRNIPDPQICVKVRESEEGIIIHVTDNGKGIDEEDAKELNEQLNNKTEVQEDKGVGLFNVLRRLKLSFGEQARFTVAPNMPDGFVCTLVIPVSADYSGKEMRYAENNACG